MKRLRLLLAISLLTGAVGAPTWALDPSAPTSAPTPAPMAATQATAAPAAEDVASRAAPALNYADAASWAAGPAGPGASAALPEGAIPAAKAPTVDVFYIHPTTDRGSPHTWNMDPRDPAANKWVDESVVARQASVFSGCCRVFAPRYRAATVAALMNPSMRDTAFELAYSDIERAFNEFLVHHSAGRPFILAGHSQGAFHAATLLERRIEGTTLLQRMVAAYIVGINLAEGEFGRRFHHAGICRTARQTGCVVQWNALLEGSDVTQAAKYSQSTFVQRYGDVAGKQTVCINPLTFDQSKPAAPASASLGAVPGAPGFGSLSALRKGAVGARCERGELLVKLAPGLGVDPLPDGGVMHYHDYGLFYADVRANAMLRVAAYLQHHPR